MNGTWSSNPKPKTAQTLVGALVIALVIIIGLLYQSDHNQLHIRITSAAQASPSPSPPPPRR